MKLSEAIGREIERLEDTKGRLIAFGLAYGNLTKDEQLKAVNDEINELKTIIYKDPDEIKKRRAFRFFDSIGFVREDMRKDDTEDK